MAKADFLKFYSEYLPKNPTVKADVDAAVDQGDFRRKVLAHGPKAGFTFTDEDVMAAMDETIQAVKKGEPTVVELSPIAKQKLMQRSGELSDQALEGVAGGAMRTSTYMCPW